MESGVKLPDEKNFEDSQTFDRVFPLGLFRHVLDYLRPQLLKDTWKKSPLACHVLVWCTMQVKVNCFKTNEEFSKKADLLCTVLFKLSNVIHVCVFIRQLR